MISPLTQTETSQPCSCDADRITALTGPIVALLDELAEVIASLTDEQYTRKPVGVMPSSVGGHVRHSLDHVRALLSAVKLGDLDYDRRDRGTRIESDRHAALDEIRRLTAELHRVPPDCCHQPLSLSMMLMAGGAPLRLTTSFPREAGYVLSHTIHHNAIISAMVKTLGGGLPPTFGYAPSTIAYRSTACVR